MVLMSVGKKWIQKHNSTQTKTNFFSSESTGRYLDVFLVLEVVRCRVMHLARVGALFLAFRPGHGDERPSHCHFLNPRPSLLLWANPTSKTSFSFFPPSLSDFFTLFSLSLSFFLVSLPSYIVLTADHLSPTRLIHLHSLLTLILKWKIIR